MMTETIQSPASPYHVPVMVAETLQGLAINPTGIYVDATFGGGGHARPVLAALQGGHLFAFDQDAASTIEADKISSPFFTFIRTNTRFIKRFLNYHGIQKIDGLLADLGISSHQIDTPERGFSTRWKGPLDMRMDQEGNATASYIVNTYSYEALVQIFQAYGELRTAPLLAKAIVAAREKEKLATTEQLKDIVLQFAPPRQQAKFLAQLFQALRIEVNDELGALKALLTQSVSLLKPGGRLVVIAYHSLEDRLVKRFIKTGNFEGELHTDLYGNPLRPFVPASRKVQIPTPAEIASNPRARSAKLRVGQRTTYLSEEV
jgi:16S rRNA (cytosine1402-N4)-methyltransferase